MNTEENWRSYTDKTYIKIKPTKQLDSHINKIQDMKAQLNVGEYQHRKPGNFV